MRQLIKMKRKIYTKIERSIYAFMMLLLSMLSQDHHARTTRQVNGNILNSSALAASSNVSLPTLTERANVNSRHLSASSTASLAAAQMAASSGGLSQSSSAQDLNRAYLAHQHQQNLQQQQQAASNQQQANLAASANPSPSPSSSQQQQVPQFNSAQPQQVSTSVAAASPLSVPPNDVTPVISTNFAFNPQTGQYQPTDFSTGYVPGGQSGAFNQFGANNNPSGMVNIPSYGTTGPQQQFRQPPMFGQQAHQFDSRYPLAGSGQLSNNLNQFINQQRQVSQFFRRNGNANIAGMRLNTNLFGQPPPSDEDSGFYKQQQQQLGDLNQYGGMFDSSIYGNYIPYSSQNNNNNNGPNSGGSFISADQSLISSQPSSIAPVVHLANPSTSASASASSWLSSSTDVGGYKNEPQCIAADNRHGTCYQASECIRRGGTPMGKCGGSSSELTGSSYVCCLFDVSCGQFAAERFVYFRNPSYPNTYDQSRMCRAKIGKLDKGICQFRLDLLRFDVAKPTNGNCSQDMFVMSGQNENYVIPKICGLNDGQHYYVGVDESGVITLHMMMMGFYRRSFEIMITQIPCRSDYAAPAHCLQYYMGTHGTIKSFNYDDEQYQAASNAGAYDLLPRASGQADVFAGGSMAPYGLQFNQRQHNYHSAAQNGGSSNRLANIYQPPTTGDLFGGYPNDLDYTMCIRKESGFCSITYQLSRSDQGLQPFAVGYQQPFGLSNDSYLNSNWHPVSTECRDDYLLIGGVRLCSGGGGGGGPFAGLNPFEGAGASIQFGQNGTVLNAAGFAGSNSQQLQQLQSQQNLLLQQLARLQQQQQQLASTSSNVSYANSNGISGNNNNSNQVVPANSAQIGQLQQQLATGSANLDQQQSAIMQQLILVQQQMSLLSSNNNQPQQPGYRPAQLGSANSGGDLQGAIITDTTSGPFLLRFVSNLARNARGFHIDYRQNPCK